MVKYVQKQFPIHEVKKCNARFFISLCQLHEHSYFVVGYTDLTDNTIHYLNSLEIGNKPQRQKITTDIKNPRLNRAARKILEKKNKCQRDYGWSPAVIKSTGYVSSLDEIEKPPQELSSHILVGHKTYHISHEQYQQYITQLQQIDDTQRSLPDRYLEQYQREVAHMIKLCQQRSKVISTLDLNDTQLQNYFTQIEEQNKLLIDWHKELVKNPDQFYDTWCQARADFQPELVRYQEAQQLYLKQKNINEFDNIRENLIRPPYPKPQSSAISEKLAALEAIMTKQNAFLSTNKALFQNSIYKKLYQLQKDQIDIYNRLKNEADFFLNPDRHEMGIHYYFNTATSDEDTYRFEYSHNGNPFLPENTTAAKKAASVPVKALFDPKEYREIEIFLKNCKGFCVDLLKSIGIHDSALSQTNVYDLSETFIISHNKIHNPVIIDTPVIPSLKWKKKNPYQYQVLVALYPRLLSMQKEINRDYHLQQAVKYAIMDRINQKCIIQQNAIETEDARLLSYRTIEEQIIKTILEKSLPDTYFRGTMKFGMEMIPGVDDANFFSKKIPRETREKIEEFLNNLKSQCNGDVNRHIYNKETLFQQLETLLGAYTPDIKWNKYVNLSTLYLNISDNLRFRKKQYLPVLTAPYLNAIEQSDKSLHKTIYKQTKKEHTFYYTFNQLKIRLNSIEKSHSSIYTNGKALLEQVSKIHASKYCSDTRLIQVMAATNDMLEPIIHPEIVLNKKALKNYSKIANQISSHPSVWSKLGSCMLILGGSIVIGLGIGSAIASIGLSTPISAGITTLGGAMLLSGTGLLMKQMKVNTFFSPQAHKRYHLSQQIRQMRQDVENAAMIFPALT